jgi:hypothetical protein
MFSSGAILNVESGILEAVLGTVEESERYILLAYRKRDN